MAIRFRTRCAAILAVCCAVAFTALVMVTAQEQPGSRAVVPAAGVVAEPHLKPQGAPSSPAPSTSPSSPSPGTSPSPPSSPTPSSSAPGSSPSPFSSPPSFSPPSQIPPSGQDSAGCGWFDVVCKAKKAINGWFTDLVKDAINPVFGMLGKSLLATPQLDQQSRVQGLWTGSLVVANACYVLLVLIGGITLMGRQSLQSSYTVKDIAPRLVVCMVASNVSLLLIGKAIEFANALSAALLGQGVDPEDAAGQLQKIVLHAVNPTDVSMFIVLGVIWVVVLALVLVLIYIVRIMLTILLIAAA